jgi:hypothetical protein
MHTKSTSAFIYLLILSIFQLAVIATENFDAENTLRFATRQTATMTVSCLEYATVANLSTIGTNSTFRAAFLQASPFGTDKSVGILNGAENTLKSLIDDKALNDECGNLTAVAIKEAPLNFTQGIVGPFRIKEASGAANNGRSVGMAILMVVATMGATVLL